MGTLQKNQDYSLLFGIAPSHSLKESTRQRTQRDSIWFEVRWIDEHDDNKRLIARYRTWSNQSLKPPYKKQVGWERYSLSGELLDREVRYSKREYNGYIH
ncbi:MAG: hypothetical protein V3U76_00185 [Granulosicoccus sp.]